MGLGGSKAGKMWKTMGFNGHQTAEVLDQIQLNPVESIA